MSDTTTPQFWHPLTYRTVVVRGLKLPASISVPFDLARDRHVIENLRANRKEALARWGDTQGGAP